MSSFQELLNQHQFQDKWNFLENYMNTQLPEMWSWFNDNLSGDLSVPVGSFEYLNDPDFDPKDPTNGEFLSKMHQIYGEDCEDDIKAEVYGNELVLLLRQDKEALHEFVQSNDFNEGFDENDDEYEDDDPKPPTNNPITQKQCHCYHCQNKWQ